MFFKFCFLFYAFFVFKFFSYSTDLTVIIVDCTCIPILVRPIRSHYVKNPV